MQYGNSVNFFRKTLPNHAKILNSIFNGFMPHSTDSHKMHTRAIATRARAIQPDLPVSTDAHYATPCILNLASFRLFFPSGKNTRSRGHNCKEINLFP